MLDLQLAARRCDSPERAAAYLQHADDETRHCQMFVGRANQLLREQGPADASVGHVEADYEALFDRLGERDFLAFVHWGEARAIREFEVYIDFFEARQRSRDAGLLRAILVDERRHAQYTLDYLHALVGEREAKRAIARVRRWEWGRTWLRSGRSLANATYALLMGGLYVVSAPFALIVALTRPARAGWRQEGGSP